MLKVGLVEDLVRGWKGTGKNWNQFGPSSGSNEGGQVDDNLQGRRGCCLCLSRVSTLEPNQLSPFASLGLGLDTYMGKGRGDNEESGDNKCLSATSCLAAGNANKVCVVTSAPFCLTSFESSAEIREGESEKEEELLTTKNQKY